MATLPPGGARRSATLGSGSSRSTTVVVDRGGRDYTIPTPITDITGTILGYALVSGVSDFALSGNALLQENGDALLQEDGFRLLLEDAASTGLSEGTTFVRCTSSWLVDVSGSSAGVATVSGVLETPGGVDNLLLEDGDDLLQENGDFILLETGAVTPGTAILDMNNEEITDIDGGFILGF